MRRILSVLIALTLFCVGAALAFELPVSGKAKVGLVEGRVLVVVNGKDTPLKKGNEIAAPAKVVVGKASRLELILPEGSVLRFSGNTEFQLVKATAKQGKRAIEVDVALGDCWAKVKGALGEGSEFKVNSPTAVAGVAGTVYRLNVDQDKDASYYVYDGKVAVGYRPVSPAFQPGMPHQEPTRVPGPTRVEGPKRVTMEEWLVIVGAGYVFKVDQAGKYEEPAKFDKQQDQQDPWVQWNSERDAHLGF